MSQDGGRAWDRQGRAFSQFRDHFSCRRPTRTRTAARVVYVGTKPSTVFRSYDDDRRGGTVWAAHAPLIPDLSFSPAPRHPPRAVDWSRIALAPARFSSQSKPARWSGTRDGGQTWLDRAPVAPIDTHTAATHLLAQIALFRRRGWIFREHRTQETPGRVASMACSIGTSSESAVDPRIRHRGLSAAQGPWAGLPSANATAYVYRKIAREAFDLAMEGVTGWAGTTVSRFRDHTPMNRGSSMPPTIRERIGQKTQADVGGARHPWPSRGAGAGCGSSGLAFSVSGSLFLFRLTIPGPTRDLQPFHSVLGHTLVRRIHASTSNRPRPLASVSRSTRICS